MPQPSFNGTTDKHFTVVIEIQEVTKRSVAGVGGRDTMRDIEEVSRVVIRGTTLEDAVEKAQKHLDVISPITLVEVSADNPRR